MPRAPYKNSAPLWQGESHRPPTPPPLSDWAKIFFGQSIISSGAFGASQFRPKIFFGASKSSAPLGGGGGGWMPPPPP